MTNLKDFLGVTMVIFIFFLILAMFLDTGLVYDVPL